MGDYLAGSATDVVECPGTGVIRSRNIQQLAEVTDVARGILGKNRFKKINLLKPMLPLESQGRSLKKIQPIRLSRLTIYSTIYSTIY